MNGTSSRQQATHRIQTASANMLKNRNGSVASVLQALLDPNLYFLIAMLPNVKSSQGFTFEPINSAVGSEHSKAISTHFSAVGSEHSKAISTHPANSLFLNSGR